VSRSASKRARIKAGGALGRASTKLLPSGKMRAICTAMNSSP
jgi:hypothetical protein